MYDIVQRGSTSGDVSVIDTNPASPTFKTMTGVIGLTGMVPNILMITPDGTRPYVPRSESNATHFPFRLMPSFPFLHE